MKVVLLMSKTESAIPIWRCRLSSLFTSYETRPNFGHQNRFTVVMCISKLPLIFIAAPFKFYTDIQNHWCFFNVL